jgi:hypothetical protein
MEDLTLLVRSSVLLQMHFTSRLPQEPNEVPTQLVAQLGRPGICAAARVESRATAVRVMACMFAVCEFRRSYWLVSTRVMRV